MNKKLLLAFIIGGVLGVAFTLLQRGGKVEVNINTPFEQVTQETASPNSPQTKVLTTNLEIPWSLVFLPDKKMLVTERPGRVKLINADGTVVGEILTISEVKHVGEGGLMGMALHPNFENNNFVYFYYTYDQNGRTMNKVVRYEFNNSRLNNSQTLLENIPGSTFHNGGRIKFGPDNLLYVTTGDSQNESSSQNRNSLAGKILRMKDDGSSLEVYSYGHRNPQGLDWKDGKLYATEHGSSTRDEVNLVEQGKNYGWPEIRGDETRSGMEIPLIHSGNDTWAPSGAVFYKDNLFFVGLRGSALYEFNPVDKSLKTHFKNEFGRIRDIVLGPDNLLYILTNNRDGRGFQKSGDDKIIVVNPEKL